MSIPVLGGSPTSFLLRDLALAGPFRIVYATVYGIRCAIALESCVCFALTAPEPTEGVYASEGVEAFIRRFGYRDREIADRMNFGGIHNALRACAATGLVLTLVGYDGRKRKITDLTGGIALLTSEGEAAAIWPYTGLLAHWNRKHMRAAYVPSIVREERVRQYRFGSRVRLGIGTDFLLFLDAVSVGAVYYDPGIKMENASTAHLQIKRRSQFRIRSAQIPLLYRKLEVIDLG